MSEFFLTLAGFVAMGSLCIILEQLWPEVPEQPAWRKDSWIDVSYLLLRIALSALLAGGTGLIGVSLPARQTFLAGHLPLGLQVIAVLLLTDLLAYWVHRLLHHWDLLWGMHAVHHDPQQIDWIVAARVHPAELILGKLAATLPVYALGFSPTAFGLVLPLAATYSLLLHANLKWDYGPLGYIITSPAFHRWHHSSDSAALDKNFAQVFAFYDFLFGTAYFPRGICPRCYGMVGNERVPQRLLGQLLYPAARLIRKSPPVSVGGSRNGLPTVSPTESAPILAEEPKA